MPAEANIARNYVPAKLCFLYFCLLKKEISVKLQWLEQLWDHENLFETGVVRANGG